MFWCIEWYWPGVSGSSILDVELVDISNKMGIKCFVFLISEYWVGCKYRRVGEGVILKLLEVYGKHWRG